MEDLEQPLPHVPSPAKSAPSQQSEWAQAIVDNLNRNAHAQTPTA
jgi:hypothetical protein